MGYLDNINNIENLRNVFVDVLCTKINSVSNSDSEGAAARFLAVSEDGQLYTAATSLALFTTDFVVFMTMNNRGEHKILSTLLPGLLTEHFTTQNKFNGDKNKATLYLDELIAQHKFYMPYAKKFGNALKNEDASEMKDLFSAMLNDVLSALHYPNRHSKNFSKLQDIYGKLEELVYSLKSLVKEYENTRSMILVDAACPQPVEQKTSPAEAKRQLFKECREGKISLDEFLESMNEIDRL